MTDDADYRCSYCGRPLDAVDELCECGNALGVLDT